MTPLSMSKGGVSPPPDLDLADALRVQTVDYVLQCFGDLELLEGLHDGPVGHRIKSGAVVN